MAVPQFHQRGFKPKLSYIFSPTEENVGQCAFLVSRKFVGFRFDTFKKKLESLKAVTHVRDPMFFPEREKMFLFLEVLVILNTSFLSLPKN